jgi:hypothetical protein
MVWLWFACLLRHFRPSRRLRDARLPEKKDCVHYFVLMSNLLTPFKQYIIPKEKKIFSYFPPNYLFERLAGRRGRQTVVRPFILRVGATATRATSVQIG